MAGTGTGTGTGIGIDRYGGGVVDPTANVIALVEAETRHAKEIRELENQRQDELREAESRRQDELRIAEQAHQEAMASLKQGSDKQMSDVLTVQVKTTSDLISKQLEKETASLANQFQAAAAQLSALITTLSERIGRLEQSRWEVTGKTSVSDPATADSLRMMSNSISALTNNTNESMVKVTATMSEAIAKLNIKNASSSGHDAGTQDSSARIYAIVMAVVAVAAVASPIISAIIIHGGH